MEQEQAMFFVLNRCSYGPQNGCRIKRRQENFSLHHGSKSKSCTIRKVLFVCLFVWLVGCLVGCLSVLGIKLGLAHAK